MTVTILPRIHFNQGCIKMMMMMMMMMHISFSHNSKTTSWLDPRAQKETTPCTERKSDWRIDWPVDWLLTVISLLRWRGEISRSTCYFLFLEVSHVVTSCDGTFILTGSRGQHRLTNILLALLQLLVTSLIVFTVLKHLYVTINVFTL